MSILKLIDQWIDKLCGAAIVVSVALMLSLAIFAILMRFFQQTFLWIDPLVRHLVFYSTFFGGALATGRRRHIGIDFLHKFLETKKRHDLILWLQRVIDLVCMLASCWLGRASSLFVKMEMEYGVESFLGIHSSILTMVIPIGFYLIAFRFFALLVLSFDNKKSREEVSHA